MEICDPKWKGYKGGVTAGSNNNNNPSFFCLKEPVSRMTIDSKNFLFINKGRGIYALLSRPYLDK
ncbi:MAG: hypothetical protein WKF36_07470 [Candidatus Nitrosocosmicus sp.]